MNGPKVIGNAGLSKIRLFAGTSEYLRVLVRVIPGSDNPRSADNQQERPTREPSRVGILRDHTPNNCRATVEDMVRTAWRHAGAANRRRSLASNEASNDSSEIPCRVSGKRARTG